MRSHSPTHVASDLAKAIRDADRKTAKKLCTRAAWNVGAALRESVSLAIEGGLDPRPHDAAYVVGDRATVQLAFMKGRQSTPAALLYLLLVRRGKVWKARGICAARAHVALFLAEQADGGGRADDLPTDEAARHWGMALAHTLNADPGGPLSLGIPHDHPLARIVDHLRALAAEPCEVVRTVWSEPAGRAGLGLRFGAPESDVVRWVVLQRVDDERGFMVLSMSDKLGMDELVRGAAVDWPAQTEGGAAAVRPDPARAALDMVVAEAMKSIGVAPGPGGKPDLSQAVRGDGTTKFELDEGFLQQHGQALMNQLFGALVNKIAPGDEAHGEE